MFHWLMLYSRSWEAVHYYALKSNMSKPHVLCLSAAFMYVASLLWRASRKVGAVGAWEWRSFDL